jgi:hypothetical protein
MFTYVEKFGWASIPKYIQLDCPNLSGDIDNRN